MRVDVSVEFSRPLCESPLVEYGLIPLFVFELIAASSVLAPQILFLGSYYYHGIICQFELNTWNLFTRLCTFSNLDQKKINYSIFIGDSSQDSSMTFWHYYAFFVFCFLTRDCFP